MRSSQRSSEEEVVAVALVFELGLAFCFARPDCLLEVLCGEANQQLRMAGRGEKPQNE